MPGLQTFIIIISGIYRSISMILDFLSASRRKKTENFHSALPWQKSRWEIRLKTSIFSFTSVQKSRYALNMPASSMWACGPAETFPWLWWKMLRLNTIAPSLTGTVLRTTHAQVRPGYLAWSRRFWRRWKKQKTLAHVQHEARAMF